MPLLFDFLSGGTEYLEKITRQVFELDQLGWKIPDPIIASYMLLGLSDRYDSLISEIQNTPLGRNGSRTVSSPTKLTLLPISSARPSKNMETPKIPLPGLKPQKRSKWLKLLWWRNRGPVPPTTQKSNNFKMHLVHHNNENWQYCASRLKGIQCATTVRHNIFNPVRN